MIKWNHEEYNHELYLLYTKTQEKNIANAQSEIQEKKQIFESLDLFRAINSYRAQPDVYLFFLEHPELESQRCYVELLWNHFSKLSEVQLADLAIEIIHEVADFVHSHPSLYKFDTQEEWNEHLKKFN